MDCPTCEAMVDAYVDGELTATESADFERALAACPDCRRGSTRRAHMSSLLRDLPAEPAPDLLRARVERELRAIAGRPRERVRAAALGAMAASLIVALGVGWLGGTLTGPGRARVRRAGRGLSAGGDGRARGRCRLVRPPYGEAVVRRPHRLCAAGHDLTARGFPLLGGRLDVVDGRKVAVLVYRRNQHKLALSLWPVGVGGNTPPDVMQRDGFTLGRWRHAGFEMRAVSDLAPAEMASFATAARSAPSMADRSADQSQPVEFLDDRVAHFLGADLLGAVGLAATSRSPVR